MTDAEQRTAIAQWMGWSQIKDYGEPLMMVEGIVLRGYPPEGAVIGQRLDLPDYTRDLNAMHESEQRLTQAQQNGFGGFLYHGHVCHFQDWCTGVIVFRCAHATAAQRAEALLRTLNLWRDDPPAP